MFYYLYEVKNLINGKIYVGVHKTHNIDDGYMGSGKVILRAIEKHGIDNFQKVILEQFDTSEAMYAREKEVVTEEFLSRSDVYNLRRGGFGGFDWINKNKLYGFSDKKTAIKGRKIVDNMLRDRYGENWRSIISKGNNGGKIGGLIAYKNKIGIHALEYKNIGSNAAALPMAREKMKETFKKIGHQRGEKNSQFGTMWITDGGNNRKISKTTSIPAYWKKGRTINK